jgi:hypothetical protein
VLAERCYQALDHDRIEFHDPKGRCAVASAGAAALGVGLCVLAAPEIVVGTIIGVSTQVHKDALLAKAPTLDVVVTGCKR